jgi:DNA-binding transcriptional ArsR family regulator
MSATDDGQMERPAFLEGAANTAPHPVRWRLATILAERPLSAAELAAGTGMSADKVRRHLRALRAEGVLEVVEERRRRNTAEQVYRLKLDFGLAIEDYAQTDFETRRRINGAVLKVALREATRSLVTAPTRRALERVDVCVTRVPLSVDEQGWTELAEIHAEAFGKVMALRERTEARLRKSGEEPIPAASVVLCFEVSPTP